MRQARFLTVKFVYSAEDRSAMDGLSQAIAREILDTETVKNSASFKMNDNNRINIIEQTYGVETSLKLSDAFAVIEDMVGEQGVVMTTISIPGEDLVTVTHRNIFKPEALQIAS